MKELENLLTSLVQRGRKPFNYIWTVDRIEVDDNFEISIIFITWEFAYKTLRDLVVLESWLWQFCMENELLNSPDQYPNKDFRAKNPRPYWEMSLRRDCYYKTEVYQYRLIESALVSEEELAKFLVDNIIISCNSK